jgi:predicted CopG family antitoxin
MLAKSIKVHDDTHKALKLLKEKRRNRSIDEVIREMIKTTTGSSVEKGVGRGDTQLNMYLRT